MQRTIPGLIGVFLLFSGCVGASSAIDADSGSATASLTPTDSTAGTGAIRGGVYDPELLPVVGATVAILGVNLVAETDAEGGFALEGLTTGTHNVVAQRLGYESRALRIDVQEGGTTWLNITLDALSSVEGYHETLQRTLLFDCLLFANPVWVSACSYPYTAVYLTAHGLGVNLSQYGLPEDVQDNNVRVNFTVGHNSMGIVSELFWQPNTDIAKRMNLVNCEPNSYDPVVDSCSSYSGHDGQSPITFDWKLPSAAQPKNPGEVAWVMAIIWPWPSELTDVPGVIIEQKVDLFQTAFYGDEPPEAWTIAPPA